MSGSRAGHAPVRSRRLAEVLGDLHDLISAAPAEGSVDLMAPEGAAEMERDDDDGHSRAAVVRPLWNQGAVDRRISQLTNGRWLTAWRRSGEDHWRPPMIEEVDQSGVNRHSIAVMVSPDELEQLATAVRRERARLSVRGGVPVWSFQHMLIQQMQELVLRGETQGSPVSYRDGNHAWAVGDTVQYCGEIYTIVAVSARRLTLDSDYSGSCDLYHSGQEIAHLRLIAPALRLAGV